MSMYIRLEYREGGDDGVHVRSTTFGPYGKIQIVDNVVSGNDVTVAKWVVVLNEWVATDGNIYNRINIYHVEEEQTDGRE